MACESIKQYDDFIETYEKLYHLKSTDSFEEIMNNVTNILINKYKVSIEQCIRRILQANKYNYRAQPLYGKLLNQIFTTYSVKTSSLNKILPADNIQDVLKNLNLKITTKGDKICQVKNISEKKDEVENMIMNDDIEKFKNYVLSNSVDKITMNVPIFEGVDKSDLIEVCAYYGAVNIFNFLHSDMNQKITPMCYRLSVVGANIDIINQCNNETEFNLSCIGMAISSHNNKFIEFALSNNSLNLL
ncbi:hypothetical protein TVAG_154780 [Trichomonas vaginalis G3]|uniref:DUF3447 domain-containing protein n=1 Tax=Trichomonas vaginalis (strain ATCC PRA-98 / G3) TaxID=412133 RepID=A2F269_TRIV3|nr:spectrin binding [Trichomonas vaginalis G3]EAY01008.1 hypothetical protein TVAG_154780 [Trichomonas vaginalis G3]KAI5548057.1 spectrin binding [Trichomonas vaginalis G3]|eukprot:XP_001330065.1 hypothetical protein [Trichomonas vaginalis G3]